METIEIFFFGRLLKVVQNKFPAASVYGCIEGLKIIGYEGDRNKLFQITWVNKVITIEANYRDIISLQPRERLKVNADIDALYEDILAAASISGSGYNNVNLVSYKGLIELREITKLYFPDSEIMASKGHPKILLKTSGAEKNSAQLYFHNGTLVIIENLETIKKIKGTSELYSLRSNLESLSKDLEHFKCKVFIIYA